MSITESDITSLKEARAKLNTVKAPGWDLSSIVFTKNVIDTFLDKLQHIEEPKKIFAPCHSMLYDPECSVTLIHGETEIDRPPGVLVNQEGLPAFKYDEGDDAKSVLRQLRDFGYYTHDQHMYTVDRLNDYIAEYDKAVKGQ